MRIKVLLVGCGDIGLRLARQLDASRYRCFGLRRHIDALPESITGIAHDLDRDAGWETILAENFDALVITLVPAQRSDAGYRRAYVHNLQTIIGALERHTRPPEIVLFASSTSVYGQNRGEWVDESSVTEPSRHNGLRLVEAERLLAQSRLATCAVRFAGIYGPGRDRLLSRARAGNWDAADNRFSNRIHVDDCAGVLAFLLERAVTGKFVPPRLLASDSEPAPLNEVMAWLAWQEQALPDAADQVTGKRCLNRRLLDLGYEFRYPTYRDGYAALLQPSDHQELAAQESDNR